MKEDGRRRNKRQRSIGLNRKRGDIRIVADDFDGPNGLAFSPDETRLYIAETGNQTEQSPRQYIRAFNVGPDGTTLSGGDIFYKIEPGYCDGMRVDEYGNIWSSAADECPLHRCRWRVTRANIRATPGLQRDLRRTGEELSFHWRFDDTIRHFLKLPGRASPVTSVQKLSRIILICRQAERLAEFYIRAFGFTCIEDFTKNRCGFCGIDWTCKWTGATNDLTLGNQVITLAETQPPGCSYPGDVPGWDPRVSAFRDCSVAI